MGDHRWQFLWQSLQALSKRLAELGQPLHIYEGPPITILSHLIDSVDANRLVVARNFGIDEQLTLKCLKEQTGIAVTECDSYTLFNYQQIADICVKLPVSFSKFRKLVTDIDILSPLGTTELPTAANFAFPDKYKPRKVPNLNQKTVSGGEPAAINHVGQYFQSDNPKHYKSTRNYIDDWNSSTKFSFWLNKGCISPRRIVTKIAEFEAVHGTNPGTEWIFVELLWREFFQWLSFSIGNKLFLRQGLATSAPFTSFYPERFKAWSQGNTPWTLVNACMNQLNSTGYLSNRGRQIAASALVNELEVDWRYGAAWFQQQLIDYDVAANWGNWQYFAGVGVDPRGGRHFNIQKQTELYDPDGQFQKRWNAQNAQPPSFPDHQDPAGWPILH